MVRRLPASALLFVVCGVVLLAAIGPPVPALGAPAAPDHSCLTDDSMDDDNDGILDADDPAPCRAGAPPTPAETTDSPSHDSDGDGLTNDADPDDDNDATEDAADPAPFDPAKPGRAQPTEQTDSEDADHDGDGLPNAADPDDDNDGVEDADDPAPFNPALPGNVTPTPATDSEGIDTDGDGLPNAADPDDDNDGVQDAADYAPFDPNVSVAPWPTQAPRGSGAGNPSTVDSRPPPEEYVLISERPMTTSRGGGDASGEGTNAIAEPVTTLPTTGRRQAVDPGVAAPLSLLLFALACLVGARALRRTAS